MNQQHLGREFGVNPVSAWWSRLRKPEQTAAAVNPWAQRAFGIDVYQGAHTLNLPKGSVDFVIARLGGMSRDGTLYLDSRFPFHVQAAYDAGAVVGAYFVIDPRYYIARQMTMQAVTQLITETHPVLQLIISGLRAGNGWKAVSFLHYDCELEGSSPAWWVHTIEDLRDRMVKLQGQYKFPKLIQGIYSRNEFIKRHYDLENYCMWHPNFQMFAANYSLSAPGGHKTLAQHRVESVPTHAPIWFGEWESKPKEYPNVWQAHGTAPGMKYYTSPEVLTVDNKAAGLDLDWMTCTRAELFEMVGRVDPLAGGTPPPPPTDEPPPPVTDSAIAKLQTSVDGIKAKLDQVFR